MNNWFKILYVFAFSFFTLGKAQEKLTVGEKQTLFSKVLRENREIWIHLPKTYNDTTINPAKYPVIYLLDAENNFGYYAGLTDFIARTPYADIPNVLWLGLKIQSVQEILPYKISKEKPRKSCCNTFC